MANTASAFRPGQKIKFPFPFNHIDAYFESIRFENGEPIIGYRDENGEYSEMVGLDLSEISHA